MNFHDLYVNEVNAAHSCHMALNRNSRQYEGIELLLVFMATALLSIMLINTDSVVAESKSPSTESSCTQTSSNHDFQVGQSYLLP